jgi:hypothetical protein
MIHDRNLVNKQHSLYRFIFSVHSLVDAPSINLLGIPSCFSFLLTQLNRQAAEPISAGYVDCLCKSMPSTSTQVVQLKG